MYYVYLHINETGVFYVGCGSKRRPWNQSKRSSLWEQVAGSGYSVWILGEFENQQDAWDYEKELIAHFKPSCNKAIGGPSCTGFIFPKKTLAKMVLARKNSLPQSRIKWSLASQGARNPNHKLTLDQVRDIRQGCGTQQEIARRYGVSQTQISKIRLGKQWSDLTKA